jgi:hypothetical protein
MSPKELRRHLLIALLSPVLAAASATGTIDVRDPDARVVALVAVLFVAAFAAVVVVGRVTRRGRI